MSRHVSLCSHLLKISDLSSEKLDKIIRLSLDLKKSPEKYRDSLKGKTIGLYFQKPSMRTRVSFELAISQLGAYPLVLNAAEIQIGVREAVQDVSRVLSRYLDAILMRVDRHSLLEDFAKFSNIPVINGLSDVAHPCQAIADILTIVEKKGNVPLKIVYIGDGNNVCTSLIRAASFVGQKITVCCPVGYEPSVSKNEVAFDLISDPLVAIKDADVIYTDVWTSMGQEQEQYLRRQVFYNYRVTSQLVALAKKDYIFMHCLPAHRGEEVTNSVLESSNSVVFDQAENRMHAQKAILLYLFGL